MNRKTLSTGVGCAVIVPAAFIGLAGLTDYAGPKGWLGFSEIIGWIVTCFLASYVARNALAKLTALNLNNVVRLFFLITGVAVFTWTVNWLGLDAPMSAKEVYKTSLHFIGNASAIAAILLAAKALWQQR